MKKEVDIDTLAAMMAEGFSSIHSEIGELRVDVQELQVDVQELKVDVRDLRADMQDLRGEVRLTNQHIDRVVMPLIDAHASRIKNLELKFH